MAHLRIAYEARRRLEIVNCTSCAEKTAEQGVDFSCVCYLSFIKSVAQA